MTPKTDAVFAADISPLASLAYFVGTLHRSSPDAVLADGRYVTIVYDGIRDAIAACDFSFISTIRLARSLFSGVGVVWGQEANAGSSQLA